MIRLTLMIPTMQPITEASQKVRPRRHLFILNSLLSLWLTCFLFHSEVGGQGRRERDHEADRERDFGGSGRGFWRGDDGGSRRGGGGNRYFGKVYFTQLLN